MLTREGGQALKHGYPFSVDFPYTAMAEICAGKNKDEFVSHRRRGD